jgi:iron complex outermembrane receptor protein
VQGQREDYKAPETATGNRTATPSLQSPQSVQVVPRAVIDDQNALNLAEALRNVSGVQSDFGFNGAAMPLTLLRGFTSVSMSAMGSMSGASTYYVDGTKVQGVPINMANVQSVEVVKGPASVLYGRA